MQYKTREAVTHPDGAVGLFDVTWYSNGIIKSKRYATTDGSTFPRGIPYLEAYGKCYTPDKRRAATRLHKQTMQLALFGVSVLLPEPELNNFNVFKQRIKNHA